MTYLIYRKHINHKKAWRFKYSSDDFDKAVELAKSELWGDWGISAVYEWAKVYIYDPYMGDNLGTCMATFYPSDCKKKVRCKDNNLIFDTIVDAAKFCGVSVYTMIICCNTGQVLSCSKGKNWEYVGHRKVSFSW